MKPTKFFMILSSLAISRSSLAADRECRTGVGRNQFCAELRPDTYNGGTHVWLELPTLNGMPVIQNDQIADDFCAAFAKERKGIGSAPFTPDFLEKFGRSPGSPVITSKDETFGGIKYGFGYPWNNLMGISKILCH